MLRQRIESRSNRKGELCQHSEGPHEIYCEKEGITEDAAVELLRLKIMEWSTETIVVDRVASWLAKFSQEWMNRR